jgi:hypothetical protein
MVSVARTLTQPDYGPSQCAGFYLMKSSLRPDSRLHVPQFVRRRPLRLITRVRNILRDGLARIVGAARARFARSSGTVRQRSSEDFSS